MELNEFIKNIASLFEDEDTTVFNGDTDFHELDSWSSLTSLSLIGMIYQEYDVELDTHDIRNVDTIEDLYEVVLKKQK